jgi:hypothetical protein
MGELGSRQPSISQSVSLTTMNRKQPLSNDSTSPSTSTSAKPNSPRKILAMKPPPLRLISGSAARDPPSKLAGLRFDAYKRAESKSVPASDAGRSIISASPVDKGKAPVKHERVVSGTVQPFSPFIFSILVKDVKPRVVRLHPRPKPSLQTSKS